MSSKTLEVIPFHPAHFDLMDMQPEEKASIGDSSVASLLYEAASEQLYAYTLKGGGKVIAIVGMMIPWPKVAHVFVFPSIYVKDFKMDFSRKVKKILAVASASNSIHRFQSACVDTPTRSRFMEFLGFVNETPNGMPKYTRAGDTYNMWAKVG